jgi:GAF domain-containing protein
MKSESDDRQAALEAENAELRRQLGESLAQQQATAEVLRGIAHPGVELTVVLQTVVAAAHRLCRADHAVLFRKEGEEYRWAAGHQMAAGFEENERNAVILPGTGTLIGRAVLEGHAVQIEDAWEDPLYEVKGDARIGGTHSMLGVPLMREGRPIGAIGLARNRVEPFNDEEVELVTTFADQAVIAIENARLLTETREALEQQTATAEVLQVISRSAFDLQPVLDTLIETAAVLCGAKAATGIAIRQGDVYRHVAMFSHDPEWVARIKGTTFVPDRSTIGGRVALEGEVVHVADLTADPEYEMPEAIAIGGMRTLLGVPLLREGEPIGVLLAGREEVQPFTGRQIELLRSFADQAVIAIENARLLNELRQRTSDLTETLEQQTATSKVLEVISRSAFDLQAVFETVAESSVRLCGADRALVFRFDGELLRIAVAFNAPSGAQGFYSPKSISSRPTQRCGPCCT